MRLKKQREIRFIYRRKKHKWINWSSNKKPLPLSDRPFEMNGEEFPIFTALKQSAKDKNERELYS